MIKYIRISSRMLPWPQGWPSNICLIEEEKLWLSSIKICKVGQSFHLEPFTFRSNHIYQLIFVSSLFSCSVQWNLFLLTPRVIIMVHPKNLIRENYLNLSWWSVKKSWSWIWANVLLVFFLLIICHLIITKLKIILRTLLVINWRISLPPTTFI